MPETGGLGTLDWVAVVGYLVVTWGIAWWATRKTDDRDDFFLGGRSMPWFAVGLSIMATLLSTITYLGAPGEMIKYGPAYFFGYAAYPLVLTIVSRLWIPFFMRLRVTSAYEYLEKRFDRRVHVLGTTLFVLMRLGWMSMVVYSASKAMTAMAKEPLQAGSARLATLAGLEAGPKPIYLVMLFVGVTATIYACVGGIKAVIWTDVVQAVMLFGGVAVIIGSTMWTEGTGPAAWWNDITSEGASAPKLRWIDDFDVGERTTVLWCFLQVLAWHSCTHCADQIALQRYFTTSSAQSARRSFVTSLVSSAAIGLLLAVSGLALRYFYLRHADRLPAGTTPSSDADVLMPLYFAWELPAGFGGLILVSFLCDALQTLGSGVNSIAATLAGKAASQTASAEARAAAEKRGILDARITTLVVGLVTTVLAVGAATYAQGAGKTIFDMLPRMFNMFLGPLAVLFMTGMFFRRATTWTAIVSILATQLFSMTWSWWNEVPGLLEKLRLPGAAEAWIGILGRNEAGAMRTPSVMLAIFVPVAVGLLLSGTLACLFGRDGQPGAEWTWRKVVGRDGVEPADRETKV